MIFTTEAFDIDLAAAANNHTAAGNFDGPLKGSKLGLIAAATTPTRTKAVADLTKPAWAGYAENVTVWGAPARDSSGKIVQVGSESTFAPPDGTTPTDIFGWYLLDSSGAKLYMMEIFDDPVHVQDALSLLTIAPEWTPTNAAPGSATVID